MKTQTENKMENNLEKLTDMLKRATITLKYQYVEFNEKFAEDEFDRIKKWIEDYRMERIDMAKNQKKYWNLPLYLLADKTPENHIEKARKFACNHYENSILKLAIRVEKYGLNVEKLVVNSSHIGVNLDCTLTDGQKTIKAFTIVASGDVQRPHYRFLIK